VVVCIFSCRLDAHRVNCDEIGLFCIVIYSFVIEFSFEAPNKVGYGYCYENLGSLICEILNFSIIKSCIYVNENQSNKELISDRVS
jgi:hypothetical protein